MTQYASKSREVASAIAGAVMLLCGAGIALIAFDSGVPNGVSGGHVFSGVCGVIVALAGLIVLGTSVRARRRR